MDGEEGADIRRKVSESPVALYFIYIKVTEANV